MLTRGIYLIPAFLFLSQWTHAQGEIRKIHVGFSITPQLSIPVFESKDLLQYEPRLGFAVGGDVNFDLSVKLQLRTGIEYQLARITYRDYSPNFPGDAVNGEVDVYKSYFDFRYSNSFIGMPLELKYKLSKPEASNHLFASMGVGGRYLISSSGEIQLVESGTPTIQYEPDTFLFSGQNVWFFLIGGLGYEFKLWKGKCSIQPRYEYSPTKLLEEDASTIANGNPAFIGIRVAYY